MKASTLGFTATFGLAAGYAHENRTCIDLKAVAKVWQSLMQAKYEETGQLVACVIQDSCTVYPTGFGCPRGGEKTVTITGHYNPKFLNRDQTLEGLKQATIDICKDVKIMLDQSTVSLTFHVIDDFVYLTDKDDNND